MARLLGCVGICVIAAALLWGCSRSGGFDPQPEPSHPLRTSPQNAIAQLEWAYDHESLGVYTDCLAEDFIFWLSEEDIASNPAWPVYWGKPAETSIHEHMFGDGGVERVTLSLTLDGQYEPIPGPNPEDQPVGYECVQDVDLRITVGPTTYMVTTPSKFRLRIDEDEVGPQGEQLWEIYEWFDLGPEDAGRVERTSWGSVKVLYR